MSARNRGREWSGCAALVRHALRFHASVNSRATWVCGGFASFFTILACTSTGRTRFESIMLTGLFVGLLVLMCWMVLFNSLVKQNAGTGALVPGIGRRSIKVLALAFCVAVVCLTAPFAIAGLPVALVCLFVVMVLILTALVVVRPMLAMVAMVAVNAPMLIERFVMPLDREVVLGVPLLGCVGAASLAVRALLQGSSTSWFALTTALYDNQHQEPRATAGYARTLKRDRERREIAALLLHCLGPLAAQQTVLWALVSALMIGVAIALSIAVPSLATQYREAGLLAGLPMGIVSVLLSQFNMVKASVRRTSVEQALVMLAVRRPEAGAVNRLLARALVLRYGYVWLMLTLMIMTVSAIFGADAGELALLLALLLSTLAAGTLLLQDYAQAKPDTPVGAILLAVGALLTFTGVILTGSSLAAGGASATLCAAVALVSFVLRRKAMLHAPVAFPAGRIT